MGEPVTTMSYTIGSSVRVTASIYTAVGSLADPGSVVLKIRKPSGAIITPALTADSAGVSHADVLVDEPGIWFFRIETSGTITTATEGSFVVDQPIADFTTP